MLRKFTVRNFKNFKEALTLDLGKVGGYKFNQDCIRDGVISKCLIYGRNATGKTNLGSAIGDIIDILWGSYSGERDYRILNANSEETSALFNYVFTFGEDSVEYAYMRDDKRVLLTERLKVNNDVIYDIDFKEGHFKDIKLELLDVDTIQTEKFLESINHEQTEIEGEDSAQVPFLRFILNNAPIKSNSLLIRVEDYVRRIGLSSVGIQLLRRSSVNMPFNEYLTKGENLLRFQNFLNVMGIECELDIVKSADGKSELFFKHNSLIPFYENASSGTIALTTLYRRFLASGRKPSLFYMDEFDAYYNYEMAEKLVRFFKINFPESQIILTTHNTNLMTNKLMRPDCLFILSGTGKLTALCDATERELREGHNLEKLYIGGEFEKYE